MPDKYVDKRFMAYAGLRKELPILLFSVIKYGLQERDIIIDLYEQGL